MIARTIAKTDFSEWLHLLRKSYRTIGPVRQGDQFNFAFLSEGEGPDLSFQNTRLSPKEWVQPASERMFQFSLDPADQGAHILKEIPWDESPRLLLGVRPCDARALNLVQINFETAEYTDPWWKHGRETLTLIGLGCNQPCSTCFCTSVGSGPFDPAGLDILLTDLGSSYLAQAVTEKGTALLQGAPQGTEPSAADQSQAETLKKEAEQALPPQVAVDHLKDQPLLPLFNAPFWDEVQFACINCGTCTYLCPTCWCFDIQDEVSGTEGLRMRNWDSCMYPLFTLHGSGHNPRDQKLQRVRQRFMHKLKYYVDKYGNGVACVGCGRCVQFCPVNIDIRRVCNLMNAFQAN
jgi:sulfhydrogenase subunit beta (sulfur reductase)